MIKKIILIFIVLLFTSCTTANKVPTVNKQCFKKPKSGMCKALFYKYYFDKKEGKCKKFVWGGCGGSIPFDSLDTCKTSCEK